MFRLDRMKSLELTDEHFDPPEDGAAELPPPLIYVPGPDDVQVRLRVTGGIAQWLADYLPVESAKDLRGGRQELVFRTSAFEWLEKLLMRFGADVEVLEPVELADRMRDAAERILKLYETRGRRS
jgi:proteasome accessory factor C